MKLTYEWNSCSWIQRRMIDEGQVEESRVYIRNKKGFEIAEEES